MKRQVRRDVFETNSSSMHSLCIMKRDDAYLPSEILDDIYIKKEGVWRLSGEDLYFERTPFRIIGTFGGKWKYACASLVRDYNDDTYKELIALALKYIPGLKKIELPTQRRYIYNVGDDNHTYYDKMSTKDFETYIKRKEKEWEIDEIKYWKDEDNNFVFDYPYTGYSDDCFLNDFLEETKTTLEEFLTNKKYVIIQDGDEYCYWENMKNTGLINKDAIDYEYPKRK